MPSRSSRALTIRCVVIDRFLRRRRDLTPLLNIPSQAQPSQQAEIIAAWPIVIRAFDTMTRPITNAADVDNETLTVLRVFCELFSEIMLSLKGDAKPLGVMRSEDILAGRIVEKPAQYHPKHTPMMAEVVPRLLRAAELDKLDPKTVTAAYSGIVQSLDLYGAPIREAAMGAGKATHVLVTCLKAAAAVTGRSDESLHLHGINLVMWRLCLGYPQNWAEFEANGAVEALVGKLLLPEIDCDIFTDVMTLLWFGVSISAKMRDSMMRREPKLVSSFLSNMVRFARVEVGVYSTACQTANYLLARHSRTWRIALSTPGFVSFITTPFYTNEVEIYRTPSPLNIISNLAFQGGDTARLTMMQHGVAEFLKEILANAKPLLGVRTDQELEPSNASYPVGKTIVGLLFLAVEDMLSSRYTRGKIAKKFKLLGYLECISSLQSHARMKGLKDEETWAKRTRRSLIRALGGV